MSIVDQSAFVCDEGRLEEQHCLNTRLIFFSADEKEPDRYTADVAKLCHTVRFDDYFLLHFHFLVSPFSFHIPTFSATLCFCPLCTSQYTDCVA